jgi:CubicO group peptidase (beta-lactamase class C family)
VIKATFIFLPRPNRRQCYTYPVIFFKESIMQIVQPESVGLSSARLQRINPVMQQYIDQDTFGGILTLVARKGQIAHLETFGWQEKETNRPMALDTIFRIYSMTKPITSAATMMLCEEGKLRLSDPISRYIPAFKDTKVLVPSGNGNHQLVPPKREILVHDLFTHSGGLSYGWDELSIVDSFYRKQMDRFDKEGEPNLEELVKTLSKLPLAFHPGTAFRYGLSIDVLGYIIQVVAGQPFEDFLQERVFAPLGMVDTAFWVPSEKAHRLAAVYGPAEGGGLKAIEPAAGSRFTKPPRMVGGGGGLVSTVSDYFRFGEMLLNGGTLDGTRLLGRKTVEWMLQNHLPEGIHPMDDPANGFGLGGAVLLHPGLAHRPGSVGKFGWGGAANTEWWIDPSEQFHCLVMLQYMPAFTIPIVDDFAQLAYQALE